MLTRRWIMENFTISMIIAATPSLLAAIGELVTERSNEVAQSYGIEVVGYSGNLSSSPCDSLHDRLRVPPSTVSVMDRNAVAIHDK